MIKNKKVVPIIGMIFIVTVLFCIFGTPRYQSMKAKDEGFSNLENKLKQVSITNSVIDISKLTNFDWDECYVFTPYYPPAEIYKKVGTEWTTAKTFIGFIMTHSAENEMLNDEDYLMVFKKGTKVVLSKQYSINELPVIFKLDNYKFTSNKAKFLVTNEGKVKRLVLKN